jgi:glucuronokinase
VTVIASTEVCARAALAGNPSDMYGGAVLAIPVRSLRAVVGFSKYPGRSRRGPKGAWRLIDAALRRVDPEALVYDVEWETTIPRSVGLAGSSAFVLAALGLLENAPSDPLALAELALSIERDDLGVPAGLQDRAVQAFAKPVLVDVSGATPIVTTLTPAAPLRFAVAWLASASGDSGEYHGRVRATEPSPTGMRELARIAQAAADAFVAADVPGLAAHMAASAALRDELAPLPPEHQRLAAAVTAVGLSPNSAGSGGSVVAVIDNDEQVERLSTAVDELGGGFVVETFGG